MVVTKHEPVVADAFDIAVSRCENRHAVTDEGPCAEQRRGRRAASRASQVDAAGAGGGVRFLGVRARADMPGVYQDADIFCLPSWWEAMPLSVLEAMAAGLPIVASDVGDVSRLVSEECGYVVPVQSPDRIADALRKLLENVDERRRMGVAARARARSTFSSSATDEAIANVYSEVVT